MCVGPPLGQLMTGWMASARHSHQDYAIEAILTELKQWTRQKLITFQFLLPFLSYLWIFPLSG